jgi:hypothetical protein
MGEVPAAAPAATVVSTDFAHNASAAVLTAKGGNSHTPHPARTRPDLPTDTPPVGRHFTVSAR